MSLHLRQRTGNRKPSFPSRINWKHPMTIGLHVACLFNDKATMPQELVSGNMAVYSYSCTNLGTPAVDGFDFPTSDSYQGGGRWVLPFTYSSTEKGGATLAWRVQFPSAGVGFYNSGIGWARESYGFFATKIGITSSYKFSCTTISSGETATSCTGTTTIVANVDYIVLATCKPGSYISLWVNGYQEDYTSMSQTDMGWRDANFRFGNMSATAAAHRTKFAFAWLRTFSDSEIYEFYKNPYAMFESKARYFWNVPVEFSKGLVLSLPSGTDRLPETVSEVKVNSADSSFDELDAENRLGIFQFKNFTSNTTQNITGSWVGKIDLAASINPIYLAAYNFNASSWETKASNATVATGAAFTLSAAITASPSNYYSNSAVLWRVYQSGGDNVSIKFWDNFEFGDINGYLNVTSMTNFIIQYVVVPKPVSFNQVIMGASITSSSLSRSVDISMGFFSLVNNVLSLFSSWTASMSYASSNLSVRPLFTNTITNPFLVPAGSWFLGCMVTYTNPSVNLVGLVLTSTAGGSHPGMILATMTESTSAFPTTVDPNRLDKSGWDAGKIPYILIS